MTVKTDTDERLARLERLSLLRHIEAHGIGAGLFGYDLPKLRAQVNRDVVMLAGALDRPVMETRPAA